MAAHPPPTKRLCTDGVSSLEQGVGDRKETGVPGGGATTDPSAGGVATTVPSAGGVATTGPSAGGVATTGPSAGGVATTGPEDGGATSPGGGAPTGGPTSPGGVATVAEGGDAEVRYLGKRRKFAVLLSYSGSGYNGMQK